MPALVHTSLIVVVSSLAFFWLESPALVPYSLQVFTLSILLYLVLKKYHSSQLWHIAPTTASAEMPVITFAFLILIGSTGNFSSIFFALSFVHLFFLVLATETSTAVVSTITVMLFHYVLTPQLNQHDWSMLISLPIVVVFFLFAKNQYQMAQQEEVQLETEAEKLRSCTLQEHEVKEFLSHFLIPKMTQLRELNQFASDNQTAIQAQLELIENETTQLIEKMTGLSTEEKA